MAGSETSEWRKRQPPPGGPLWMGTLGCTDIWEELDTHHGEREINKPSPYSSAILSGETLIRHLAEYI